jgi:hypothetical protein
VAGYMVMGNVDTQHINSFGYCQTHLDGMVNEFNRGCLSLLYFENNTREHEHADEVLVKRGYCDAYFL